MIQLITDMMSNPRIQSKIVSMLQQHLKKMNVRMATHLVLMAMQVGLKVIVLPTFVI